MNKLAEALEDIIALARIETTQEVAIAQKALSEHRAEPNADVVGKYGDKYFGALKKADSEYGTLSHRDFTVGWDAAIAAMQGEG